MEMKFNELSAVFSVGGYLESVERRSACPGVYFGLDLSNAQLRQADPLSPPQDDVAVQQILST
jgi:hypothetical protein